MAKELKYADKASQQMFNVRWKSRLTPSGIATKTGSPSAVSVL